jgi:DNA ligase 1
MCAKNRTSRFKKLLLVVAISAAFSPAIFSISPVHATTLSGGEPPFLLAQNYSSKVDPTQYLVSEKLDGVRAFWDGQQLYFRSGRVIHAPVWFTAGLPKQMLDGELWIGRKTFERLSAAVRRQQPQDEEWKSIRYQVYELPNAAGDFSERYSKLQSIVKDTNTAWLQVLPQQRVTDQAALQALLAQTVKAGGEGLMLHRADAPWKTGRSDVLLKLKPQQDAEATVIAHELGKGKYAGMLGALVVQMPDGKRFKLGTGFSDEQRHHPPAIGSTVTYRYRDFTSTGVPRFASFLRERGEE